MSIGRIIGALIDGGIFIASGMYIQFFLSGHIQKRIAQGKEKPEMAEKIKKNGKWAGWLFMLLGVFWIVEKLSH
jgi:hypothetical protein